MKNSEEDSKGSLKKLFKTIEAGFNGIASRMKKVWNFFTNPTLLLGLFKLKTLDTLYNKFLENETMMKLVALIGALILVFMTRYSPEDFWQNRISERVPNYELVVYQDENHILVDSAIPSSIEVLLVGERNQVEVAIRQRNIELYVDLTHLEPGTQTVHVRNRNMNAQLEIIPIPSTFTVTIAEIEETIHRVEPLIINRDALPEEWAISEPKLSQNEVLLRGAATVLANVASVQAAIDIQNIAEGHTEFEVSITAFDNQMNSLPLEIIPGQLTATLDVFTKSEMIPFSYIIRGMPPTGQSISEVLFKPAKIEMFGDASILEKIEDYPLIIDLSQLDENGEVTIPLTYLEGVQYLRENQVTVQIIFQQTMMRTFRNVTINRTNLGSGLAVESVPTAETQVDVLIRGAQRLLDLVTEEDLVVTIDLNNLGAGEHRVPIRLATPEFITGELDKTFVEITIIE